MNAKIKHQHSSCCPYPQSAHHWLLGIVSKNYKYELLVKYIEEHPHKENALIEVYCALILPRASPPQRFIRLRNQFLERYLHEITPLLKGYESETFADKIIVTDLKRFIDSICEAVNSGALKIQTTETLAFFLKGAFFLESKTIPSH